MELLPLSGVIFSLLAGTPDAGDTVSDTQEDSVSHYAKTQTENFQEDLSHHQCDESEDGVT